MKGWFLFLVLLVLCLVFLAGCTPETLEGPRQGTLEDKESGTIQENQSGEGQRTEGGGVMGKVLFIIAQNQFRDEELEKPKEILEDAGFETDVASLTTDTAVGMLGARVKPDLAVMDAEPDEYDLIVVVGGMGAPELAEHDEVLELLSRAKEDDKKLGAICLGPLVLAKAGVLQGKKATVFKTPESVVALGDKGAVLVDEDVVVDESVVTANGPDAAERFGRELVDLLQ